MQRSLEDAILQCDDQRRFHELLGKLASIGAPSAKLDDYLRQLIDNPLPHLTAAVLRVYRYTGSSDLSLHEAAAHYLTIGSYDGDWYDEAINSIGWANELVAAGTASPLVTAYQELLTQADKCSHEELLKFCQSYSR